VWLNFYELDDTHSAEDWCVMTVEDEHAQREEKTTEDSLPQPHSRPPQSPSVLPWFVMYLFLRGISGDAVTQGQHY